MVAASTILIGLALAAVIPIAGTFFTGEIMQLFQLLFNNIFYTGILIITLIVAWTFKNYVDANTDLSPGIAALGALLVVALGIGAPFLTGEIAESQTTYSAQFQVNAGGGTLSQVTFNSLQLQGLEESGPRFFNLADYRAGLWGDSYQVDITVTCNGEQVGSTTATGYSSSVGYGNTQATVYGLPPNSQCTATAELTNPPTGTTDQVTFTTP
jgi:hypothetical protein